jgi:ABC-type hemin transport system ATPase subunit
VLSISGASKMTLLSALSVEMPAVKGKTSHQKKTINR